MQKADCNHAPDGSCPTEAGDDDGNKAGDLDEALRIPAGIQAVQAENRQAGANDDIDQKYVGIWRFHGNQSQGYILFNDGSARLTLSSDGKATWSVKSGEACVSWGGGVEDRFRLEDGVWVHRICNYGKVAKIAPGEVDFAK